MYHISVRILSCSINPLQEEQDRTRKRVREDLKDSHNAHVDYMENILPRLKRTYFKKIQDVDVSKTASVWNVPMISTSKLGVQSRRKIQ